MDSAAPSTFSVSGPELIFSVVDWMLQGIISKDEWKSLQIRVGTTYFTVRDVQKETRCLQSPIRLQPSSSLALEVGRSQTAANLEDGKIRVVIRARQGPQT